MLFKIHAANAGELYNKTLKNTHHSYVFDAELKNRLIFGFFFV